MRHISAYGKYAHLFYRKLEPLERIHSRRTLECKRKCSSFLYNKYGTQSEHIKNGSMGKFPPAYVAAQVEAGVCDWWEREGFFKPKSSTVESNSFSIVLPPPNVTGTLHLGHALTTTIQDVLARWHRMQGKSVSWIPGTDHAGIATQVAVEKKLWQEQQLTRHDLGRDQFQEEVWKWKDEKCTQITQQLRKLGASLDWSKETFTMDSGQSAAVKEAFIRLFDAGLIYRAKSLVNWSCVLQSAISDIEVVLREIKGPTMLSVPGYSEPVEFGFLTHFAYKVCNSDEEIVVSTTRVETIIGDVAVAVHPHDERYKKWHGAKLWHPFRNEPIPVICDEFVDPAFGTGAVKITPGHNHTDYEIGKQHDLRTITVIFEDGTLKLNCGKYAGMNRFDARKDITEDLKEMGLLRGRTEHAMTVPVCSRSGDVVEFMLKSQWFVNCKEMARHAIAAVQNGDLQIEPRSFEKTWFNWLENIRDWCISRQLWWGHQVPMYQCHNIKEIEGSVWVAANNLQEARSKAALMLDLTASEIDLVEGWQDNDVLDTWFSSALFPFSVHGWPSQTEDLAKFYPLNLMETGHDILFFWVARMVMLGMHCTGVLPFKKVLLHGIICDAMGRKMSKSLGNVINPEDVIKGISAEELAGQAQKSFEAGLLSESELKKALASQKKLFPDGIPECGTDALRFTLCSQDITNFYINFDVNKCHTNRAFCNKIWQACKYIRQCFEKVSSNKCVSQTDLSRMDFWILSRLAFMVNEVDRALHNAEFHSATAALKTFLYSEFCDVYLEATKPVIRSGTPQAAAAACWTLAQCAQTALCALSPFMPFVTEELYQQLPQIEGVTRSKSIMIAPYPKPEEWSNYRDDDLENEINMVNAVVVAIRRLKSTYNIQSKSPEVHIINDVMEESNVYKQHITTIAALSHCGDIVIAKELAKDVRGASVTEPVGLNCSVHILIKGKDTKKEQKEILKKSHTLTKDLAKVMKITQQPGYSTGASPQVQETHHKQIRTLEAELNKLKEYQAYLSNLDETSTSS